MAIIKTYPLKNNYYGSDRLILSDMQPDDQGVVHGTTKSLTLSNLKSFIGSQVIDVSASTTDRYKGAFVSPSTGNVKVGIDLLPLTMLLAPNGFDYLLVTDDPSGNPINKKTTVDNFFSSAGLITNSSINYTVKLPNTVGGASQVLQLPSVIGSSPHQLEWSTPAGSGTVIGTGTTNYIPKWNSSSELTDSIVYENGANIGINTSSPSAELDVQGANVPIIKLTETLTGGKNILLGVDTNNGFLRSSGNMLLQAGSSYQGINILESGNVGIGTSAPNDGDLTIGTPKLHVATLGSTGAFNLAARFQSTTADADNTGTSILINSSNDRGLLIKAGRKDGDREVAYFDVVSSVGNLTNMLTMGKFSSAYNVGIGTTTPAAKLDILDTVNQTTIRVTNNQYNNYLIQKRRTDGTQILGIKEFGSIGGLALVTGGSERLNITNLGRVDINGDGSTNAGKLRLNCSANTHSVEIVGPDHSGGTSYSLKLPNSLPSVSNQILESNALGVLSWIPTPSGGGGGGGTVTSVGLSAPPAFSVNNSPITGSGSISLGVTGGTTGEFLAYNGQWDTPTDTNTTYSLGTGSTAGQIVLTGSNPSSSQTVTVAGTNGISIAQFTSGTFNVNLDLATSSARGGVKVGFVESGKNYPVELSSEKMFVNVPWTDTVYTLPEATATTRGGIELFSNTTQATTANSVTTTASRTYGIQLNSAGQAVVNVPWSGGSGGGISFSGTTVGGLATFTNSSTAGVSSKVTLNSNGLIQLDADNASGSRASIDYNPTGNRLQLGDFSTQGGIVELYTNGSRGLQIGINGELGLGTTASQGTSGQVLTSGGNGAAPTWTAKTIVPSNVVTGAGNIYEVPMWNPQNGVSGSYIGAGNGFTSSPFKSNASGQSIISTEVYGGITFRQGSGAQVKIDGNTGSGGAYQINLPSAVAASTNRVLGVNSVSGSLMSTAWVDPGDLTSITGTTSVNSTTFANTPFTFANTSTGSGVGSPLATSVGSQYGNKHISFYLGTTFSGSINQSGSNAVSYTTSSDYRLKENVIDMIGSVDRLKQLKPSRFNFIADGPSRTIDGFLAHEVSSIVPEAITGSKDAIDAEDNIIPQGIDQSKLVPLLVGAIKELTARIEALEA